MFPISFSYKPTQVAAHPSLSVHTVARTYAVKSSDKPGSVKPETVEPKLVEPESDDAGSVHLGTIDSGSTDSPSDCFESFDTDSDHPGLVHLGVVNSASTDSTSDRFESFDTDSDDPGLVHLGIVDSASTDSTSDRFESFDTDSDDLGLVHLGTVDFASADSTSDRFLSLDTDSGNPVSVGLKSVGLKLSGLKPAGFKSLNLALKQVEPESIDLDAVERQIGHYDKAGTVVAAAACIIPTLGGSWLAYRLHHSEKTREKVDASYSLAKAIINEQMIPLSGGGFQLEAGGFIFTDIQYQNQPRVALRKSSDAFPTAFKGEEMRVDEKNTSDLLSVSQWEFALKRLVSSAQNPVTRIEGVMTVHDVQLRAANLVRAKAERDTRFMLESRPPLDQILLNLKEIKNPADKQVALDVNKEILELLNDNIITEFVKLAGIYALAEALLKPDEAGDRKIGLAKAIAKNNDSIHILTAIFGFPQPDKAKHVAYKNKCAKLRIEFDQSNLSGRVKATNAQKFKALDEAIECGFNAFQFVN